MEKDISYVAEVVFTSGENVDESASFEAENNSTNSEYIDVERDTSSLVDSMPTYSHSRDVQRQVRTLSSLASAQYGDIDYEGDALTIFEDTSNDVEDTNIS